MMRPAGEQQWLDHAALLNARLRRFQLHVEPDWLFALCRECGFSLEQLPPVDIPGFRYEVATHVCGPVETLSGPAVVVVADALF